MNPEEQRGYLDGVADGLASAVGLAEKLRAETVYLDAEAALDLVIESLREASVVWRDAAVREDPR